MGLLVPLAQGQNRDHLAEYPILPKAYLRDGQVVLVRRSTINESRIQGSKQKMKRPTSVDWDDA